MTDPLDPEEFYDLTLVSDLTVSPSGDRVAFVAEEFDATADERRHSLFVVPTDGSRDPHRLTRVAGASSPAWSPDGSKLAFLAARETDAEMQVSQSGDEEDGGDEEDEDESSQDGESNEDAESADSDSGNGTGDDEPESQIWAFDLELGGDARQITDFEEGASEFDWGPDGERLVVAARDPTDDQREYLQSRREEDAPIETERLQHKYNGEGWLDDVTTYLFVVDVATREATRLDDAYGAGAREPATGLDPAWSPSSVSGDGGHRIAFLSNRTDRPDDNYVMDVYTIAPDGSDLRKLTDSDLTASRLRWHPEADRLAFVGRDPVNSHVPSDIVVASEAHRASDASGEERPASPQDGTVESWSQGFDRTVARYGRPSWRGDEIVAAIGDEGLTRLATFRGDSSPERTLDAQGRDRTIEGFDLQGDTTVVHLSDPRNGPDLHAVAAESLATSEELTRLTALNDDLLADRHAPECRRVSYESEGHEVEGLAYLPEDFDPDDADSNSEAPDPRPLVVSVHGGPVAYDAPRFAFFLAHLTGQGYVVLKPNYRGSSSYGQEFSEQIRGDWGPRETADVLAGVDELVAREWADPDRLFATGFSYGGMTTAYLVAETDRFAGAAAEHGVYDYRAAFGTDDSHVWWENDFGLPWENPEGYDAASSITDVGEMDTPLLVTAGGEDWRCPPSQSEQLYVSVKKQGVPSKLVVYPDEYHNIGDPDRAVHRIEEITAWFERFDSEIDSERSEE